MAIALLKSDNMNKAYQLLSNEYLQMKKLKIHCKGSRTTNQMSCQIRELFRYNTEYMNLFIVSTNGYLYY